VATSLRPRAGRRAFAAREGFAARRPHTCRHGRRKNSCRNVGRHAEYLTVEQPNI
jgi:hypothetical protein